MTSLVDAEAVLAIDVGSLNTRALLFDVVDGQYRFIASSAASTTSGAPFFDVSEGVLQAIQQLQQITGRAIMDTEGHLTLPSLSDGTGIDRLAITTSAGADLKIAVLGLLSDVSLHSVQRLAGTTYGQVVETIGLNDRRKPDAQLDALLAAGPDLILVAGGTEKGATRSVNRLVELVGMACRILPRENRPRILYCGNGALAKRVKESLEREAFITVAPNIRPSIDLEDLNPAATMLAKMSAKIRASQLTGLSGLTSLSSAPLQTSAFAMGRMMRFMSAMSNLGKPTLGVDLGASATTLAVGSRTGVQMSVDRSLGIGLSLQQALQASRQEDLLQWLADDTPAADARDYLYQKSLYPASLPLSPEALRIEHAMARQILRLAVQRLQDRWPGLVMSFEYIFLGGATLAQAPSLTQSLLMALDGLQPVGVNVLMLDPYGLSQALGSVAGSNTLLPAQILESGTYINLATVICPVSFARPGTPIMKLKINYEDGSTAQVEIKQGSLVKLPIRQDQAVNLQIEKRTGVVLDPAAPRLDRGIKKIVGGACGVIVDARGRPLHLPDDSAKRRDLLHRWQSALE